MYEKREVQENEARQAGSPARAYAAWRGGGVADLERVLMTKKRPSG